MRIRTFFAGLALLLLAAPAAQAQWKTVSGDLYDQEVKSIAVHPERAGVLYAGTKGGLFCSEDAGKTWKMLLGLRAPGSFVNTVRLDPSNPARIFAGTDEGLYRTDDGGKKWKKIFERAEEAEEAVTAVAAGGDKGQKVLAGTRSGLYASEDGGASWFSVPDFTARQIYQIEAPESGGTYWVASEDGLYIGEGSEKWQRIYAQTPEEAPEAGADGNAQLGLEQASLPAARLAFAAPSPGSQEVLLMRGRDFMKSSDLGRSWRTAAVDAVGAPVTQRAAALGDDARKFFVPTNDGIYFWDSSGAKAKDIGWGLPSGLVHETAYDPRGDALYAATDRGVFQLLYPETTVFLRVNGENMARKEEEVFAYFSQEPSVLELQQAAMRYAEVHPEKILEWRRGASLKPWIPALSVSHDWGTNRTVDIDRGGTGDVDRFIMGPDEEGNDFGVDVSWDLSEILWNPDQALIDNRSKLMVQLRDDLLSRLNHLYFARRRLQIESALSPSKDLASQLERELQIQEYTAGLDALTGGYLSKALANGAPGTRAPDTSQEKNDGKGL